jgi:hypothetical protein
VRRDRRRHRQGPDGLEGHGRARSRAPSAKADATDTVPAQYEDAKGRTSDAGSTLSFDIRDLHTNGVPAP